MPTHWDSAHPLSLMHALEMVSGGDFGSECFVAPLALIPRTLNTLLMYTLNVSLSTRDAEESLTASGSVQSWARNAPKHVDHKCMLTRSARCCVYLVAIELSSHRTGVLYAFMLCGCVVSRPCGYRTSSCSHNLWHSDMRLLARHKYQRDLLQTSLS
jgi:hypothetical protein